MKYELTTDSGASRLILIFAGWSTDASFYSHICVAGYDTMVVWDYSDLNLPLQIFDKYHTICLFAWSLGVYAATATLPFDRVSMAIAINGTEQPVDDLKGIPASIYSGTAQTLDDRNLMKFRRRMSGIAYNEIKDRFPETPIAGLKLQLEEIERNSRLNNKTGRWNRVYISDNDAIFPPANQERAWLSHQCAPEIRHLDEPHYIDIANVVKGCIPANMKVGERFKRALDTYDGEASAQKRIANHLLELMPEHKIGKAIEIGPGSGLFTTVFSQRFRPSAIDYIDLYRLPEYNAAPQESYHIADAEEWLGNEAAGRQETYDAIVSASAIQWFMNPVRFFSNAHKLLKPGGILACSSFLPGNLSELTAVNPYGLIYHTENEIRDILSQGFEIITTDTGELTLEFPSPREVLRHIKDTGVGGSSLHGTSIRNLLTNLPSRLTYHPVYIIARKKICP